MAIFSPGDIKRFKIGQITANGTNPVVISAPGLEADSFVYINVNTVSGTIGAMLNTVKTTGANGSLTYTSVGGNTSVYDVYVIT